MKAFIKRAAVAVVLLGGIATAVAWYYQRGNGQAVAFQTAAITRGELLLTIAASGTLEPEEVVDVGAQISGRIVAFGPDVDGKPADYGSVVAKDAVIAKIDDALYQADAEQAEAQVASAKAGVLRAQADLGQLKAKLVQAQRDWERAQKLGPSQALAQASYDAYESAYETAKAGVAVGEAAILQAQAALSQAEKSLWRARRNLEYCTITSPITGTVIDRRVSIGQTVASGLNTPSLFLIAKDLRRMQVWVAVNEADIARVYPGQPVTFTVDALPDQTFRGTVFRIRPNASMTQNVVTFTVEIAADNAERRLRPYLTANVRFEVNRRENVLLVPTAALSWTPALEQIVPEYREGLPEDKRQGAGSTRPTGAASRPASRPAGDRPAGNRSFLWVVQGPYVRPIPIRTGLSDGTRVEVSGADLREGIEVVTGVSAAPPAGGPSEVTNPFAPKLPKRGPPRGGPPPV